MITADNKLHSVPLLLIIALFHRCSYKQHNQRTCQFSVTLNPDSKCMMHNFFFSDDKLHVYTQ